MIGRIYQALKLHASACETTTHQLALQRQQHRLQQEAYIANLLASPRYADPRSLGRYSQRVFSQFGQDGIINEIMRRIDVSRGVFIEIGVHPLQSNTTYLVMCGWRGVWCDPTLPDANRLPRSLQQLEQHGDLILNRQAISPSNAAGVVARATTLGDVDLLSIDIDYNTHHLFEPMAAAKSKVVIIEYNPHVLAGHDWSVPYDPDRVWQGDIAYGASLKHLERLGRASGYNLVGCDISGNDAYFVRDDLVQDRFLDPFTAEMHYEPPRQFLEMNTVPCCHSQTHDIFCNFVSRS